MRAFKFLGLLAVCLGFQAEAQLINKLKLDHVSYKGIGCPQGSVQFSLSPDQGALSFLFDQYSLQVPQGIRRSLGCNIRFQMTPPYGQQLRVLQVDYRGFTALSAGAVGYLVNDIRQSTQSATKVIGSTRHRLVGPNNEVFTINSTTAEGPLSNCSGWPVIVNIESRFEVDNRSNDEALMSVDSSDLSLSPATTLHLAWVPCRERPRVQGQIPIRAERPRRL